MQARRHKAATPPIYNDALGQALTVVGAPLLFGLVGALLDGVLGIRPVLTALFAGFGLVGAMLWLYYQYLARSAAHDEGQPWARKAR